MLALYRARNIEDAALAATQIHATCFPKSWDEDYFTNLLRNPASALFFASEAEEIALALLHKVDTEAEILTLGVKPEIQREGIGSGLLWFAEKSLEKEGVSRVFLEVSNKNIAARNLYRKLNYKEINRRPNYYPDGSDAICMEKQLIS